MLLALCCAVVACDPSEEEAIEAARRGDLSTLKRAVDSQPVPPLDRALYAAVSADQQAAARLLLQRPYNPSLHFLIASAKSQLEKAPLKVSPAMAKLLMDHGAPGGAYLLPYAIRADDLALAQTVLAHPRVQKALSAGPKQAGRWLAGAASGAKLFLDEVTLSPKMASLLMKHGLETGQILLKAARTGDAELLKAALDAGAGGAQALVYCLDEKTKQRPALVRLLLERGARRPRALTVAAELGDLQTVKLLLQHGAKDIETALMNARRKGHTEIIAVLESHPR